MAKITLRGREIPLILTTLEIKQLQEEIAPIGKLIMRLIGRAETDDEEASMYMSAEHLDTIGKTIRILGNAGIEEDGGEPDLTDKWVMRALKPSRIPEVIGACISAINEGMESEIPAEKAEGPVDVTLEKINKKKEKES